MHRLQKYWQLYCENTWCNDLHNSTCHMGNIYTYTDVLQTFPWERWLRYVIELSLDVPWQIMTPKETQWQQWDNETITKSATYHYLLLGISKEENEITLKHFNMLVRIGNRLCDQGFIVKTYRRCSTLSLEFIISSVTATVAKQILLFHHQRQTL